jgi:hypothetical protein
LATQTTKINPYASLIITTDKGETLAVLDDIDITIEESDRIFLLLKMPKEIKIFARASITQVLLKTYNIKLNIDIKAEHTYEKIWKFPTYVGMKIGMNSVTGNIKWSDDGGGDHDIDLSGTGTIWHMRG